MTDEAIDPGSGDAVRTVLASLIDLHGPALLHEPDRLKRQLDGALPQSRRDVELILSSMRDEVPHALLAAHSDEQSRALLPQLVDRLVRHAGIDRAAATWAVRTWAHALAVAVDGGDAGRPDAPQRAVDRRTIDDPRSVEQTDRPILEDRDAARRSSAAEVLGFGTRPIRHKAPSTVRPPPSIVSPPTAPAAETLVAFDASRERAIDAAVDRRPVGPIVAVTSAVQAFEAEAAAAAARPVGDANGDTDVTAPVVPTTPTPDPTPTVASSRTPATIASDAPAVAEHTPAAPFRAGAVPPRPPPEAPAVPPTLALVQPRRSSSRTFALAAAIAAVVIVVGATMWPAPPGTQPPAPVADATATPAPSAVAAPPADPRPVESVEPVVVASQAATSAIETRTPGGTADSAPPPAAEVAPPVGATVAVPAKPTPAVVPSAPRSPPQAPRAARLDATVGRQVAIAPTAPAPKVAKAAEPRKPTPAACTRSTCGSVVSVRAIDDTATRDYEVIVRLDDRTIRAVRMPARWSPGARVRVVGSRFEPVSER